MQIQKYCKGTQNELKKIFFTGKLIILILSFRGLCIKVMGTGGELRAPLWRIEALSFVLTLEIANGIDEFWAVLLTR